MLQQAAVTRQDRPPLEPRVPDECWAGQMRTVRCVEPEQPQPGCQATEHRVDSEAPWVHRLTERCPPILNLRSLVSGLGFMVGDFLMVLLTKDQRLETGGQPQAIVGQGRLTGSG